MKPPIADPFGAPVPFFEAEETKVFGLHLLRVYFGMLLMIVGFFSPFLLSVSDPVHGKSRLHSLFFAFAVLPLWLTFVSAFLPVKINRFGIQIAPLQSFIEWSEMKSARYCWMGLSHARISIQGRFFKMWLPLTLRDPKGFARAVEEWAPADNPLRLFLQKRGF